MNKVFSSVALSLAEVCTLDADVGDCKAAIPRYFHNQQSGRCERFSYGGCGGNENRFVTLEECQEACGVESPCNLIDCAPGAICHVDTDGDAECMSITSCLIRSCPTGFSCERDPATNMAECVPILITIDPCEFTDCDPCRFDPCKPGTMCELNSITGDPECVPIDRCSNFPCRDGFTCKIHPVTNEPQCVPKGLGCALIRCLPPAICRIRRGDRMGYCGGDPCETHNCGRGFECRYNQVEDAAECVPSVITNNPCSLRFCPPGTGCEVNELGAAVCRSIETPCALILCDINSICRMRPGTNDGYCGPHPCNTHVCELGTECRLNRELDIAECVPTDPCLATVCRPGTTCVVNELGAAVCRLANPCIATLCAVGTICEVDPTGSPVCVPAPHPCATIKCRKPDICRVRPSTQIGYCGVDPCIAMNCGKNYECSYNEKTDEGECVPTAPCLLQDCPTGQVCKLNEDTGEGVCSPPDLRCMIFDCPEGTVCQPKKGIRTTVECVPEHSCSHIDCGSQLCRIDQVSGRGYCGIDPCTLVRCFNCRYNPETDGPQCMGDPCATVRCSEGTTCRVDENGEPECVSPCEDIICGSLMCRVNPDTNTGYCGLDPCTYTTCEAGTQCRFNMKLDAAECVAVDPCATIECRKPDICRVRPNAQKGYCGVDPCIAMNCGKNYECSYNEKTDEGECVPTAPCLLQDCPSGQVCKLNEDTGEGVCSPPDLRCMIFDCPEGTVCQPKKGIRTTVECVPEHSCSHIDCGSQLCRIDQVSGRGYCGIDPCTLVRCFNCRYNPETDGPQCMGDPCATVRCSEGTTCRVDENGEPECVSPCEDIICGSLMCRVNPDTNTGYCGLDPCTYTTCEAGTQCRFNMKLDAAECVAVDPCATMDCAEGTTCQVDSSTGEAQCVLDPPDIRCFLLQCAAGFVCQANEDGSVECVQEDPCSGRNCGQLMCRVRPDTHRAYCGLDPCTFTNCREGTECRYNPDLDTAVCVNPTDPCDGFSCTGGDICRVNLATGLPFCGITPCAFTTCFVNTLCIYDPTTDSARCVAPPDPCDGFRCNGGDICRVNLATGLPFCDITPCAFTTCFVNTVCIYDPTTDAARCVAPPDPCDGFRCNGGDICRVNQATQEPFCGIDFCTIISCAPHTRCNHDPLTDIVTCEQVISPLPDACTNVQCAPWTRCEVNERSVAECVSICSDILCGRPLVCRVNATTQEPYCGNFPCRNFRCVVPGTECQYDYETDGPRCSFVDNSPGDVCNPDPCPFDFECVRNTRGNAECLLLTIG